MIYFHRCSIWVWFCHILSWFCPPRSSHRSVSTDWLATFQCAERLHAWRYLLRASTKATPTPIISPTSTPTPKVSLYEIEQKHSQIHSLWWLISLTHPQSIPPHPTIRFRLSGVQPWRGLGCCRTVIANRGKEGGREVAGVQAARGTRWGFAQDSERILGDEELPQLHQSQWSDESELQKVRWSR